MSNVKVKSIVAACVFAVLMAASCIGFNIAKADAAADSVPTIADTVTKGKPGVMTVENEIKTALMPVGHALYIYGGGWNENQDPTRGGETADTGANPETETIGVPQIWADFYSKQNSSYTPWDVDELDFNINPKCVHWGIDCAGYLGWVLQNIMGSDKVNGFDTNGLYNEGWVTYAQWIGFGLQDLQPSYGKRIANPNADIEDNNTDPYQTSSKETCSSNRTYDYVPGNIYTFGKSGEYHCWLCLGQCSDDSVLLLHCSDPGVFICGTSPNYNEDNPLACDSEALKISRTYMKRYYTDFYNKFGDPGRLGKIDPNTNVASGYLKYSEFNWDPSKLTDAAGLRAMSPQKLMDYIYCEDEATATLNYSGQVPVIKFNDALVEPSATANSQIVYNRDSETDATVDVSFVIPAGYKFDSVKINDVDYATSLVPDSNTAKVTAPIAENYKIETVSSEVGASPASPATEIAKTGDINYVVIAICILLIVASGVLFSKKKLG